MKSSYLILGATGAIGYAFTKALLEAGEKTTVLVRNKTKALNLFGVHSALDIIEGDIADTLLLQQLAKGKRFIFHGVNVSYEHWAEMMPVMTKSIIDAAEISGATVIFPGNNYNYGNTHYPISEITPFNPSAKLGKVRVQLEQMLQLATDQSRIQTLVVRMAELWGPNVTNKAIGPIFENAQRGKAMPWLITTDVPQQLLYNLDAGRAILSLCRRSQPKAYEVYNLGGTLVPSIRSWFGQIAEVANKPLKISTVPRFMVGALGLFVPVIKELKTLLYKYENTILLNDDKFHQNFSDFVYTPMDEAIADTLQWFRQNGKYSAQSLSVHKHKRKQSIYRFVIDNAAIGLFPIIIALLGTQIGFLQNNAVLFGVVAGIYWTPGLHALATKMFPGLFKTV